MRHAHFPLDSLGACSIPDVRLYSASALVTSFESLVPMHTRWLLAPRRGRVASSCFNHIVRGVSTVCHPRVCAVCPSAIISRSAYTFFGGE
jgi:hypothetical protein